LSIRKLNIYSGCLLPIARLFVSFLFFISPFTFESLGQVIQLDQRFQESSIDSIRYWRAPHQSLLISADSAWKSIQREGLKLHSNQNLGSKFTRGLYDYWYQIIIINKSNQDHGVYIDRFYNILSVSKVEHNILIPLKFIDQYSNFDPNNMLKIKERQGFTANILVGKTDTFLVQTYSPSVMSSYQLRVRDTQNMTNEYLRKSPWITLYNGMFLGCLILCFAGSLYYYFRTRLPYVFWYVLYLFLFIFYFWREFEFLNKYFDVTHQWITWHMAKFPLGALIFMCYMKYIHELLETNQPNEPVRGLLKTTMIMVPICIVLDILFQVYYPYGSYLLMYGIGIIVGILQSIIVVPLYRRNGGDKAIRAIIIGSVFLFIGWLSIVFFEQIIHQIILRICSLIELLCFVIAIAERGMSIHLSYQASVLKQAIALKDERIRISSELHDEIGATLTGISMYAHLTKSQLHLNQNQHVVSSLRTIQTTAEEMLEKLNEVIWSVQNDRESLYTLLYSLEKYCRQITSSHKTVAIFQISEDIKNLKWPITKSRNLYLFCKEAITNAAKYSRGTFIKMIVTKNPNSILIEIVDDGIGFDIEKAAFGNGIENMKQRKNELNGEFLIRSKPGEGTCISLEIKIK
jgi:signal transduction histidine kinase